MINDLIILCTIHFIADWGLQNRWMARNKSKYWEVLSAHCFINAGMLSAYFIYNNKFYLNMFIVLFCSHFITDIISSTAWNEYKYRWILWIDHIIHFLTIFTIYIIF